MKKESIKILSFILTIIMGLQNFGLTVMAYSGDKEPEEKVVTENTLMTNDESERDSENDTNNYSENVELHTAHIQNMDFSESAIDNTGSEQKYNIIITGDIRTDYCNIDYESEIMLPSGERRGYYLRYGYDAQAYTEYIEGDEITVKKLIEDSGKQNNGTTLYLQAEYQPVVYNITYDYAGGTPSSDNMPTVWTEEEEYYNVPEPNRQGYLFLGWKINDVDEKQLVLHHLYDLTAFEDRIFNGVKHPTEEVSLKALWEPIIYYVKLVDASGRISDDTIVFYYDEYGQLGTRNVEMYGYELEKWSSEPFGDDGIEYEAGALVKNLTDIHEKTINLYARWKAKTYRILYNLDGGTNDSCAPTQYTTGTGTNQIPSPTKPGYLFEGWYKESNYVNRITKISQSEYGDITLYAKWKPISYRIKLYPNTNTTSAITEYIDVKYDEEITIPSCGAQKPGYTFSGWNTTANGTGTGYLTGDMIKNLTQKDGDVIILYAQWKPNNYAITYVLDGGTNNSKNPSEYVTGKAVTLYNPSKTGYIFSGWYTDANYKTKISAISAKSTGDVTLYAKWEAYEYTIMFRANASNATGKAENLKAQYGTEVILPDCPFTRPGYRFIGWNTISNGSGKSYAAGEKVINLSSASNGTITLYAQWVENVYFITYDLNGGINDNRNPESYKGNVNVTLYNPTKAGYTFAGWYLEPQFVTKVTSISKNTAKDITLYAKWEINTFDVQFAANGGTGSMDKIVSTNRIDFKKIPRNEFTRSGYIFAGWNTRSDGSGMSFVDEQSTFDDFPNVANKGTITLYAQWDAVTFNITYELDGGINNSANPETYSVAKDVTLKNPEKAGYTFGGWFTEPNFSSSSKITKISRNRGEDLTIYAKWIENVYSLQYNPNGGTGKMAKMVKIPASKKITLQKNEFSKKGYTFVGWNTSPKGTGESFDDGAEVDFSDAKNNSTVTLYAQWYAPEYVITYELDGGVNNTANPETYSVKKDVNLKNPTRSGYTFKGWYTDPQFSSKTKITKISKTKGEDITVYAKWVENVYNISYKSNGGKGKMSLNANIPATSDFKLDPNTFTRTGFVFAGWNTSPKGTGKSYDDEEIVNFINVQNKKTISLYAQWYAPEYTITYELDGGTNNELNPDVYSAKKDVSLKNPIKRGYTFKGWYTDPQFSSKTKITKISKTKGEDITVYAKWSANKYTVKYNANGGKGTMSSSKFIVGEEGYLKENQFYHKENKSFVGWSIDKKGNNMIDSKEDLDSSINKNGKTVTLYAIWK